MEKSVEQPSTDGNGKIIYDSVQIQEIIPHRYPFVMIDRIVEFEDNKRIVGIKQVTTNEYFFQGHFPGRPVMPGVLIIEAMAQTGAILARKSSDGSYMEKIIFLVGVDRVKWKRQVIPGDTMRVEMISIKKRRPIWVMQGTVTVEGKVAALATITAAEAD
jgi:beta-hydroxyacyl-ACP dehydratase FabZ